MTLKEIYEEECTKYWCTDDYDTWLKGCIERINGIFETDFDMDTPEEVIVPYLIGNEPYEDMLK